MNINTQKRYPLSEKPAVSNFYQMFHREPSFMSDTRNQCLQLVLYLKRGLVHKLGCRVPFDQDKIFLSEQIVQTYFITILGKESRRRKDTEKTISNICATFSFHTFTALWRQCFEYRPTSNRSKRNNFFSFIHWRQNSQNRPQYHIVSVQYFSSQKVSKHMTVSAVFQGHKGNHKHKSLPPPIANPPPSKSSLAVLPETYAMWKPLFTSLLESWSKTTICGTIYTAAIYKGNFTPVDILFRCGLTSVLNTLKNFIYLIKKRFSTSLKKLP